MRKRRNNKSRDSGAYDSGTIAKDPPQPVGGFFHTEQTADGRRDNDR
jgi:hypothetical protein